MTPFARRAAASAIALCCSAALTACGGGSDAEAKENIKAGLVENENFANADLSEEQAGCLADGMVDDIGVDKLQEYGLLTEDLTVDENANPDDMSADDADALAAVMTGCVDVQKMVTDQLGDLSDQLTDEQRQCVEDAVDEDAVQDMLSQTFQGEQVDPSRVMSGVTECLTAAG